MNESAQAAVRDFARLAGEDPLTLYGDELLRHGATAIPASSRERYPGITSWNGITELKSRLLEVTKAPRTSYCLLANRSSVFVRLAAKCLSLRCRKVMIADLCWPQYLSITRSILKRAGVKVVLCPVRTQAFDGATDYDLAKAMAADFAWHRCDGAVLPTVSHDGVRLPIDRIVCSIRDVDRNAFVVADASQAIAQVPDDLGVGSCDIVIAGAHKWLESGLPLGIGILSASARYVADSFQADDALLSFSNHYEDGTNPTPKETANVWPLIACRAAIDEFTQPQCLGKRYVYRLRNVETIKCCIAHSGWKVVPTDKTTQSAIVLVRGPAAVQSPAQADWRKTFQGRGIALTAYRSFCITVVCSGYTIHAG